MPETQSALLGIVNVSRRRPWRARAACAVHNPQLWYADEGDQRRDLAIMICSHCPVQAECLSEAIANREQHGVWGGLTPSQRQRVAREREWLVS